MNVARHLATHFGRASGPDTADQAPDLARRDTLAAAFNPRDNGIGFLRFALATMVLLSHAFALGGLGPEPLVVLTGGQEGGGSLAVAGFFILSGFLVTRSYERARSPWRYLWHRCLRILPGYWVCILVTAFGFGTVFWIMAHGTIAGYITASPAGPLDFVANNAYLQLRQYGIADTLASVPFHWAINDSLWTLWPEFACYLLVGGLGVLGILRRAPVMVLLGALLLFGAWIWDVGSPFLADPGPIRWPLLFLLGAAAHLYRERLPIDDRLAAAVMGLVVVSILAHVYQAVAYPLLAYLVLWAAIRLPIRSFDGRVDLSYGIYIYAFPSEQLLASIGVGHLGLLAYVTGATALTLLLATASWHLVEKRALQLKEWPSVARTVASQAAP